MSHDRPVLSLKRKTVTPETGDTPSAMPARHAVIPVASASQVYQQKRAAREAFNTITLHVKSKFPVDTVQECFEAYTDNYKDFPPDELVKMNNINVQYNDDKFEEVLNWRFVGENNHKETPSGKNGVVVNNSGKGGEIDFYFR